MFLFAFLVKSYLKIHVRSNQDGDEKIAETFLTFLPRRMNFVQKEVKTEKMLRERKRESRRQIKERKKKR